MVKGFAGFFISMRAFFTVEIEPIIVVKLVLTTIKTQKLIKEE
jgi:hypothetical protein